MIQKRRFGTAAAGFAVTAILALATSPAAADFSMSVQTQSALASVSPGLTGDARTAAIEATLESVLKAALSSGMTPEQAIVELAQDAVADGIDGTTVATAITLAATAPDSGISATKLGVGLGEAAATLEKNGDKTDAIEIAAVVANDGPEGSQSACASSATQNGGSTQLADTANSSPQAVGESGTGRPMDDSFGNQNFLGNNATGNESGVNSSCPSNNPSCNS